MIIPLDIPDAKAALVRDAMCANYGYQDTVDGQPNPETKTQFTRRQLANFIRENVHAYRVTQATETAKAGVTKDDTVAT